MLQVESKRGILNSTITIILIIAVAVAFFVIIGVAFNVFG